MFPQIPIPSLAWHVKHCKRDTGRERKKEVRSGYHNHYVGLLWTFSEYFVSILNIMTYGRWRKSRLQGVIKTWFSNCEKFLTNNVVFRASNYTAPRLAPTRFAVQYVQRYSLQHANNNLHAWPQIWHNTMKTVVYRKGLLRHFQDSHWSKNNLIGGTVVVSQARPTSPSGSGLREEVGPRGSGSGLWDEDILCMSKYFYSESNGGYNVTGLALHGNKRKGQR